MRLTVYLILAVSLCACSGRQSAPLEGQGDTLAFKYADLLTVVSYDSFSVATIKNPWKPGMTLHRYVMVPKEAQLPERLPEGTLLRTPLSHSLIFTTVHCAMLMMLNQQTAVAGVADLKYIKVPWIQQQVERGAMADVGDGMSPVIEKIIDEHPDAILLSPFENSGGYGRVEEIGIPLIECAEYMEPTPLARAEWLRFYGILFGCEQRADSLFQVVDNSYHQLSLTAQSASSHPTVLVDKVTGSVWYVPGGHSTIGQMVSDAGGCYLWADDDHSGSVSLPFEAVLGRASEADVWLFRYSGEHDITSSELLAEHHGYSQFAPFRSGRAYGCDVQRSAFYEESPFRPDWLLGDFIRILHPGLLPDADSLRYYRKLVRN